MSMPVKAPIACLHHATTSPEDQYLVLMEQVRSLSFLVSGNEGGGYLTDDQMASMLHLLYEKVEALEMVTHKLVFKR